MGLDINSKDKKGSSPLHWACYSQAETAMQFILALKPNIDQTDREGFTPLHITVRGLDEFETSRPIKVLLISGASLDISDNIGNFPIDYSSEIKTEYLRNELKRIF